MRTRAALGASIAAVILGGCSTGSGQAHGPATPSAQPRDLSARGICLAGVHHTPIDNLVVDRAVLAPLSLVKAWVLHDGRIDWRTFSSSLKDAPLEERVAICVFSKRDGSPFTMPPGVDTPTPQASVVEIVRSGGRGGALFMMGSRTDMLAVTPSSLRSLRRLAS